MSKFNSFLKSRLAISTLKGSSIHPSFAEKVTDECVIWPGVIVYTLAFVLIFNISFTNTLDFPIVLTSLILITIAGGVGKSLGAFLDTAALAALGVACGALGFLIIAVLASSPVARGFVFFVIVYFFAYVKAIGLRYFGFSLLGIIVAFNGLFTSILLKGFEPAYLQSYLIACKSIQDVNRVKLNALPDYRRLWICTRGRG